jgi:chromosome partitioning protein
MDYRIAIANEKGGVAKTTSAISIGAVLAEMGHKTLMIDLDPQANLSLSLGFDPGKIQKSSASLLLETAAPPSIIKASNIQNLDMIPANSEAGLAERSLPGRQAYESVLLNNLNHLSKDYTFVVMDCPPFLGAVTLNALVASHLLIIPTQAEFFSIYALRNLMGLVRRVRNQYNPRLTYRLLLTMVDRRNRTHRTMSEQLRSSFDSGVFHAVIEVDTKLRESPIAGVPIIHYAPKSRSSLQYHLLAQEILEYVKEISQPSAG